MCELERVCGGFLCSISVTYNGAVACLVDVVRYYGGKAFLYTRKHCLHEICKASNTVWK